MPIEFSCPSCHLRYSVKDELAGKGAKCGKCGHRMKIPQPGQAEPSAKPPAKSTAPRASAASTSSTTSKKATASPTPSPKKPAPTPPPEDDFGASWLDEDLEKAQPVVAASGQGAKCPACGAPLPAGSVLCVSCGYDTRTGAKLETQHVELDSPTGGKKKSSKLSKAGSLLRGTLFSFLAAVLGAIIWAVLAYFTHREFGIVAWAFGGLVGFGMALGHEDDDGTFAGIIAAFMSLFGIIVAKLLIIAIFVGAHVAHVVGDFEAQLKRAAVTASIAQEKLEADGIDVEKATEEQMETAMAAARAEVDGLSEEALEQRFAQWQKEADEEELAEGSDEPPGDEPADAAVAGDQAAASDNAAVAVENGAAPAGAVADEDAGAREANFGDEDIANEDVAAMPVDGEEAPEYLSVLWEMFSPIDGLFILLAFFTAYKVGSGEIGD
jgi:predicted Zn finger-like uncharacterized protein